ncbi:MAG: WG repeat-containing protein [Oscillospiraceae bacterium]|nr:WG repeat-containing protein [Oscillospiraceae bacterium]
MDKKNKFKEIALRNINIKSLSKLNLKIFLRNSAGILLLLVFTHLTVAYSQGRFELPFYDRGLNSNGGDSAPGHSSENGSSGSPAQRANDIDNIQGIINPDDLILSEVIPEPVTEAETGTETGGDEINAGEVADDDGFPLFSEEMKLAGFSVSDGVYGIYDEENANLIINNYKAEVNRILNENAVSDGAPAVLEVPEIPEAPLIYEYRFVKIEPGYEVPDTRVTALNMISKRTVDPMMDFFVIRSGEYEILCAADGKVITRDFSALNLEITRMRDSENRTVFKSLADSSYYIYDPEDGPRGSFAPVNFDPVLGNRGVPFMYPSYYGANGNNNRVRTRDSAGRRLWGYADSVTGRQVVTNIYNKTFNFSENIGVAYQDEPGRGNRLFLFNESGQNLLTSGGYYAPDENRVTTGHLGYFYFDHGLTRAYSQTVDRQAGLVANREVLLQYRVDSGGYAYFAEFYIPSDYIVKAYSNGMILLEKDGFYGFMNYLGEWVAQPIYIYAQPFFEGVAVIGLENGKRALIDTKGNLIAKFKYDAITNCTGGIVALYERNEGWTILNKVRRTIEIG